MENFNEITDRQTDNDENNQPTLKRASTWIRFWAFIIDHFVITVIVVVPVIALEPFLNQVLFWVGILLIPLFLYAIKDIIKGQSLGKFIFGIAVRNQADTLEMPSATKLILRNIFVFLWPIEFLVLVFSKTKMGDRLAETNVYYLSEKPSFFTRLAVALAIPISLVLFVQFGVGPKTPLTAEEFTYRMEEAGFVVEDIMYRYVGDDTIESALTVRTELFHLEFAVFNTEARARGSYGGNRQQLEAASRGMIAPSTSVSILNFNRFAITFEGQYVVISRIENTIVIVSTSSVNRAAVDDILRMLGY